VSLIILSDNTTFDILSNMCRLKAILQINNNFYIYIFNSTYRKQDDDFYAFLILAL